MKVIVYKAGKINLNADAVSKNPTDSKNKDPENVVTSSETALEIPEPQLAHSMLLQKNQGMTQGRIVLMRSLESCLLAKGSSKPKLWKLMM